MQVKPQVPLVHARTAPAGAAGQGAQLEPHESGLVLLRQDVLLQMWNPSLHVKLQAVPLQVGVELGGLGQRTHRGSVPQESTLRLSLHVPSAQR